VNIYLQQFVITQLLSKYIGILNTDFSLLSWHTFMRNKTLPLIGFNGKLSNGSKIEQKYRLRTLYLVYHTQVQSCCKRCVINYYKFESYNSFDWQHV